MIVIIFLCDYQKIKLLSVAKLNHYINGFYWEMILICGGI